LARHRWKRVKPGRTEAQVLAAVLAALRCYGIDADRRNTGAAFNPRGRLVCFGRPGDADISGILPAGWGSASGKALHIETKREGFDPRRLRGAKRAHFDRQLARLRETNRNGGYGLWVTDATQVVHALGRIREGWRIELEGDWPTLVSPDEPRPSAPISPGRPGCPAVRRSAPRTMDRGDASEGLAGPRGVRVHGSRVTVVQQRTRWSNLKSDGPPGSAA
jgi:hypothetical protein